MLPAGASIIKTILLSVEHGAWGFLLEAVAAGLLLAPTLAGFFLAVGIGIAFFAGQAIRYYLKGFQRRSHDRRVILSGKLAVVLAALATGSFIFVYKIYPSPFPWILFIAAFMLFGQGLAAFYWGKKSLPSEILGGVALGFPSAAIIAAAAKPLDFGFLVWGLLALRTLTSTIYVRHQLRKSKGENYSRSSVAFAHLFGLGVVCWLAIRQWCPWPAVVGVLLLSGRALVGILGKSLPRPREVGFRELGWGMLYVVIITGGFFI